MNCPSCWRRPPLRTRSCQATTLGLVLLVATLLSVGHAQEAAPTRPVLGPYEYEAKPDHGAFRAFNPRKAPAPGDLLLRTDDRLAIVGDSITEQRMYSRIIETYLTVCVPDLNVSVRQFGWSGEKTDGFLARMENDCLRFKPTIATLCYGMNDSRYRPFDITNGHWYDDHYTAIVRRFKQAGARVVVGSPGCAGKLATWVQSRVGTLEEHNLHLCALRDISLDVAQREQVAFADMFWPMYQAQVLAPSHFSSDGSRPYEITGRDGIHPNWAGHLIMAYSFLRALGLNGDVGTLQLDLANQRATATSGHQVESFQNGELRLTSHRYPFYADGPEDQDDSLRSGMMLVPFGRDLNRLVLKVTGMGDGLAQVTWGSTTRTYSAGQLAAGINLAEEFPHNPFGEAFARVDAAVAAKQLFETKQIKQMFHGAAGQDNLEQVVAESERERDALVANIKAAFVPVTHTLRIER